MEDAEPEHPWYVTSVIVPIVIAVIIGAGSSYVASEVALARHDERLAEIEKQLDETPTRAQLNASEDRSQAYTDAKFSEIMITLTQLNATSKNTAEDVREIKADLRELERRDRQ
jgi:predicted membrane-bound mannosyltransferase